MCADTRCIQETTLLVSPSGKGNGVSCSQWYSAQGSCSTELHVSWNCVSQSLFTGMICGDDYTGLEKTQWSKFLTLAFLKSCTRRYTYGRWLMEVWNCQWSGRLQNLSAMEYSLRKVMWYDRHPLLPSPRYNCHLLPLYLCPAVVLWCDMLGNIHRWCHTLSWSTFFSDT